MQRQSRGERQRNRLALGGAKNAFDLRRRKTEPAKPAIIDDAVEMALVIGRVRAPPRRRRDDALGDQEAHEASGDLPTPGRFKKLFHVHGLRLSTPKLSKAIWRRRVVM